MHKIEKNVEESEPNCHAASLLAYHLVNLVLQEGCMIANAAIESGRPREYLSMRKNVRSDLTYVIPAGEDAACVDSTVETYIEGPENDKTDPDINLLVTSTPQKHTDEKAKRETGQGDEDVEVQQSDLSNATSLFINNLFDISDVELGIYEEVTLQNADHGEQLGHLMNNVMDMYVNAALEAFHAAQNSQNNNEGLTEQRVKIPEDSSFFYLEETLSKVENGDVFYVDVDKPSCTDNVYEIRQDSMQSDITIQQSDDIKEEKTKENSQLYENAYLTLNRDYDQCSEEEVFPILKDPRGMIMQEIELLTANTSNDTGLMYEESEEYIYFLLRHNTILTTRSNSKTLNKCSSYIIVMIEIGSIYSSNRIGQTCIGANALIQCVYQAVIEALCANRNKQKEDIAATSGLTTSSRKSGLVQRCRQQGTKFLACLRGWWRRKATRKRKEARESRLRGLGPLSPDPRRHTASVLEHRSPSSPAPSRYKCSTINEALLNSSQWMDYTFETKSFDCGDV